MATIRTRNCPLAKHGWHTTGLDQLCDLLRLCCLRVCNLLRRIQAGELRASIAGLVPARGSGDLHDVVIKHD